MARTPAPKKRWIIGGVAAFTAAGLTGGAVAAAATAGNAHPARLVNAVAAEADPTTTTTAPGATPSPGPAATPRVNPQDAAIDALVADGTLTKEQGDKVKAAIDAARPAKGAGNGPGRPGGPGDHGRRGGPGGPGGLFGGLEQASQAVADAIGITTDQLRTELQSGKSLADIATAHGKTKQDVVDAVTKEVTTRLDAEVKDGHLTQAQADDLLAKAKTMIDTLVTSALPFPMGGGMGGWPGGRHAPPAPAAPTTTTTTN